MKIEDFLKDIKELAFVDFDDHVFYPEGMELNKYGTKKYLTFKNYDELFKYVINGKTIKQIIESPDYEIRFGIC